MKKYLICFIVVINSYNTYAQLFVGAGATLSLKDSTTLTLNNANATINSNITSSNGGKLLFKGNTQQTVNANGNKLSNVELNNSNGLQMLGDAEIDGSLNFVSGKMSINGNAFTLSGSVVNANNNNCFVGSNNSKFIATTGTGSIFFDQSQSADVNNVNGTNALQNLEKTNNGSVVIANKINVFDKLAAKGGTINLNGNVVLRSTNNNTAFVDKVTGVINGEAIVERYIHKQFRGWRALTAPITYAGSSMANADKAMQNNWQSSWGFNNNYGTRVSANVIPSTTNAIDDKSNSASVLTYNTAGVGSWNRIENTKTENMANATGNADNKGFFVFVRGDRTVLPTTNGTNNAFVPTTLAAKGLLQTGTQTFNYNGNSGNSWLVGNPFACPVDMSLVDFTGVANGFYLWDPNLTGSTANSPGAYTSFDRTNWAAGPVSGNTTKFLQSGAAFFVRTNNTTANIVFEENDKVTSSQNNTNFNGIRNGQVDLFNIKLFAVQPTGAPTNVDGLRAKYGDSYSANVDAEDIPKISGSIENISLIRNGSLLSIEARPYIKKTDTLFINLTNLVQNSNYQFLLNPINFDASVKSCKLIDRFLNSQRAIPLTVNTIHNFSVTTIAGSYAANRFIVVFEGNTPECINGVLKMDSIVGANSVCVGSSVLFENNTPLPENAIATWSVVGGRATINQSGILTATSGGFTKVKYAVVASGCSGSIEKNITTNALPAVPSIAYAVGTSNPQAGCAGGLFGKNRTFSLVGIPSGGVWMATGQVSITSAGVATTSNTNGAGSVVYSFINNNGCSSRRTINGNVGNCSSKGITSQQSTFDGPQLSIYPNPAKDIANIILQNVTSGSITLTDVYGKIVSTQLVVIGNNTIDVSRLAKGTYFITLVSEQNKTTQKLIVE